MSEWKKVKIGDFLKQYRNTIYVDDSQQYKQVTISSKSGVKYRCSKIGKEIGRKRQFLIDLKTYPNTVIFTRQGLHEGSIGLAPQEVDGCIVTENMPMFSVDETIVDTFYLKYFLLSPAFSSLISTLTPTGSAQKSIHERDLLPLEISLPDLQTQQKIVCELAKKIEKVELIKSEIESQKAYAKQLRQNILQEAIEGKLTEEWRKENPVVKGNPDFDAEALFEKIQEEKCHTDSELLRNSKKKEKSLPEITEDEKPFEIPEGWKWVRLGEIVENITSGSREWARYYSDTGAIFLRMGNLSRESYVLRLDNIQHVRVPESSEGKRTRLLPFDLLFSITAEIGNLGLIPKDFPEAYINQHTARIRFAQLVKQSLYFANALLAPGIRKLYLPNSHGMKNSFRLDTLSFIPIPLPPLAEQKEIVSRVEKLLANVTELEKQITEREEMTKQLMQSIMKDAFREG